MENFKADPEATPSPWGQEEPYFPDLFDHLTLEDRK